MAESSSTDDKKKKYFIVYWHPEPKSFNGSMYTSTVNALLAAGHEVQTSNLYEMNYNPVSLRDVNFKSTKNDDYYKQQIEEMHASEQPDGEGFTEEVAREHKKLAWCDVLIMQFPLWWFSLPAVMKGWVDRTLSMGVLYGSKVGIYATGPMKGKKAILNLSTGGPESTYAATEEAFNGDINGVLRPIHRGILEFVGFSVLKPHMSYAAAHGTPEDRQKVIDAFTQRIVNAHDEEPIVVGRY